MFWQLDQKFDLQKILQIRYITEIRKKYLNQSEQSISDILDAHLDQMPFALKLIFDKA